MSWILADGDGVVLRLHIQPGAKKTEVAGLHGEALKIRLAAPPVDGKANACLVEFLARQLGVAKSAVELVGGDTSRAKRVRISRVSVDATAVKLGANEARRVTSSAASTSGTPREGGEGGRALE